LRDLSKAYLGVGGHDCTKNLPGWGKSEFGRLILHETIFYLEIILNLQRDGSFRNGYTRLASILDLGRAAKASDPRDHVYGLMGIFQPDLSKLVAPNYDASISDVFRDFALSVIDVSGQLDMIYHGRKGNELGKLDIPSWVPDWSQEPKDYITILNPVVQAAGTSKPIRDGSENKNLLK
jgi:hypothetical protein